MNLKRIIKEEIDDFDWAKETNPIQCKDLKGYYFYYGEVKNNDPFIRKFVIEDVFIKNPRGYGRGNDLDSLKIYYTWRDRTTFDWNQMECDTFIHRVKGGDYTLYDKNGVKVNPRDLAYTDGTFDDDERKEIWEQDESDDLNWIKKIKPNFYCENLGELKPGDIVKVNGRINRKTQTIDKPFGITTFKNDIGVVLSVSNSDREIYINGELKNNIYAKIAFKEWKFTQGYSVDDTRSWLRKILDFRKKYTPEAFCNKYNCYNISCDLLNDLTITPIKIKDWE